MSVAVCPADNDGCGNYRLRWPAESLIAEGHDVTVLEPGYRFGSPAEPIELEHDTIVIQRPMTRAWPLMIKSLRARGHRVVVDLDDDLAELDPRHPMHGLDHRPLLEACELADLVTVSTPALAARYGIGHNEVIRNLVPERYLTCSRSAATDPMVIGTTIVAASHPGDLDEMRGFASAVRKVGAQFVVIGSGAGYQRSVGLEPMVIDWQFPTSYPHVVAQFAIGVAPLKPSRFNDAKSWLRPLEMAALGVPCIASATSEYRALGTALELEHGARWEPVIKRLAASPQMRAELAAGGRARAADLTIEGNAQLHAQAWATQKRVAA